MLDDLGFHRPTYAELLAEQETRARQLFGDDIETGEATALGKYIRLNVYDYARLYELAEKIYYARFPNFATGVQPEQTQLPNKEVETGYYHFANGEDEVRELVQSIRNGNDKEDKQFLELFLVTIWLSFYLLPLLYCFCFVFLWVELLL